MIPKKIHYCWFGKNKMPKLAKKCLKSWKKYCSDYEIICWNEDNFDINKCPLYVRQAYENKKWAFVADYARLKIIYENGGIYFDTDVEVLKNFDEFLKYDAFFGFESKEYVNTGVGFGAKQNSHVLKMLLEQYEDISFVKGEGGFDLTPCPVRNTEVFKKIGLKQDNTFQILNDNLAIYPTEYFCPVITELNIRKIPTNTYSIHWFSGSWYPINIKIKSKIYRVLAKVLGEKNLKKLLNKKEEVI